MDPIHKEALKKCRTLIVRDLTPEAELWDLLVEQDIFTPMMMEYIQAERTRTDKNRRLLDDLVRRGPTAFGKFLLCLRRSGHSSIADTLVEHERIIRRQRNPCSSQPVPATSGNEDGQMLFSGSENLRPLPRDDRNVNATVSGGVIGQETSHQQPSTSFAIGHSQPVTGLYSNISKQASGQEENMITDDVLDGTQSQVVQNDPALSSAVPGSSSMTNVGSISQQSEPRSMYQRVMSRDQAAVYKMESNPRGYALIVNNKNYIERMGVRVGTDVDCSKLENLFKSLGYVVTVKHDLTAGDMAVEMNEFAHDQRLYDVDSLAVVILSHGHENEKIYGVDGRCIETLSVLKIFAPQNCPAMYQKPKMIVVNACRGVGEDHGFEAPCIIGSNHQMDAVFTDVTSVGFLDDDVNPNTSMRIPHMQDFLIAYSTFPGHVSIRNTEQGSWFIQALCDVFQEQAHEESVLDMLTAVNRRVANYQDDESSFRQIPAPATSLIKKWLMNPPVNRA